MIKNIGYYILFILLMFIVESPFLLISIKINEGDNLYYSFFVMIIFFLPSLVDFLYNRKDKIFSVENLFIGFLGLIVTGILFLFSYSNSDLNIIVISSSMIVVPLELILKHYLGKDKRL